MKKKISITLSSKRARTRGLTAGSKPARSLAIERAIRSYLRKQNSAVNEVADLELINAAADQLNFEAAGVLKYSSSLRSE